MSDILFREKAFDQYMEWFQDDKKTFKKISILLEEIKRTPFNGRGKPEPLKENRSGKWSRRITKEHRLVYHVEDGILIIDSCNGHYED